jgi:hypothetical protein
MRRVGRIGLWAGILMLLWAAALMLGGVAERGSDGPFVNVASSNGNGNGQGPISHSNSKSPGAILSISNMKPGDSSSDTVTITNTGAVKSTFTLEKQNVVNNPGSGGGALSSQLDLTIQNITNPSSPVLVYAGKIGAMTQRNLGQLAKDEQRTYRFTVSFPSASGNSYQGSSMSVGYLWTQRMAPGNSP